MCRALRVSFVGFTCLIATLAGAAAAARALTVEKVIDGVTSPVRLVSPPGDLRLFVVEQPGTIGVFTREGASLGTFLDLRDQIASGGERGLLGLAFAPDYASSGRFYVNYTDTGGDTRIVRYEVDPQDPNRALPSSASPVLTVDQPYSNHNGGHIEFGPDGMLYVGMGDGGSGGDPENRAQNDASLLGKMLRLDVDVADGYAIPADNPFVGEAPRDEIWAKGLRNPWCFSFDRESGDLWIGDVGQSEFEEIDVQLADSGGGENYGWRLMEGSACFEPSSDCNDGSLVLPVHEYSHGGSPYRCSITGGCVYRGALAPALAGRYLYADYCSDQVWALTWTPGSGVSDVVELTDQLAPSGGFGGIASFGQDAAGEVYIVDLSGGAVYRIVGEGSDVEDLRGAVPLEQNVPNPFNPVTEIAYRVPAGGASVRLEILDLNGNHVRTLIDGPRSGGRRVVAWNGTDESRRAVASGVYFYRYTAPGVDRSRKMVLLR